MSRGIITICSFPLAREFLSYPSSFALVNLSQPRHMFAENQLKPIAVIHRTAPPRMKPLRLAARQTSAKLCYAILCAMIIVHRRFTLAHAARNTTTTTSQLTIV
jgi:hypothetical protein